MVSLLSRRRRWTPIGLDIGASSVRAVQVVRADERHTVTRFSAVERQTGGSDDGKREKLLATCVRACFESGEFRGRRAVAALNPPAVEVHTLELPEAVLAGKDANTPQVVRWEVERLSSRGGGELETRHWSLPRTTATAPNTIAVAAQRGVLLQVLEASEEGGMSCERIDIAAAALARFGAILKAWSPEEVWGVLDIGYDESRLVLCVGETPVVVRRAGSGGRAWTQRIADSLQLSQQAAETHKREHGIALTGRGVRTRSGGAPHDEVGAILLTALRSELTELASEVKRSYEYALSCYPSHRVGELALVGGGAALGHLPEFLGGLLGIPVRRGSDYISDEGCRLRCAVGGDRLCLDTFALAVGLTVGD